MQVWLFYLYERECHTGRLPLKERGDLIYTIHVFYIRDSSMKDMKESIVDSLIQTLNETTLEKITVTDIAAKCGISRQTFYYHFNDIYDIVRYFFLREIERAFADYSDIDSWQTGYMRLLKWAKNNKALVMNTYFSTKREYVEVFLKKVSKKYISKIVRTEAKEYKVTENQCNFIEDFYTLSFSAFTLEWIRLGMVETPENIVNKISLIIDGDFQKALGRFQDINGKGQ